MPRPAPGPEGPGRIKGLHMGEAFHVRTCVLGSYVYLPGLMSLDHMYTYEDLCPASDGRIGPAAGSPECQTLLSERLQTSCKPGLYLPSCTASFQIACCVCRWLSPGTAQVQGRCCSTKHHGSEGRIGPAAGSPECQTLLSERLETSCKPGLYLPFGTASFQIACCILQVAFVWHSSGPRVPRAAAQGAKRCMPRN